MASSSCGNPDCRCGNILESLDVENKSPDNDFFLHEAERAKTVTIEYVSSEEQTLLEFARYWEDLVREEKEIHDSKRHRYTGGRDPLENYVKSSDIMAIAGAGRTDRGALVSMIGRLSEKVNRIATMCGQDDFIQEDQGTDTDDEDFRQTCQDISIIAKLCAIDAARLRGTI